MSKATRTMIKKNVMDAFQDAEEIGYAHREIMAELSNRLQVAITNNANIEG